MTYRCVCEGSEYSKRSEFARDSAPETYNRRNVSREGQVRDIRVGKLGEFAFGEWLKASGFLSVGNEEELQVFLGVTNVDGKDFATPSGKTIDVKTASKAYHEKILVPWDQFESQPKDIYVGVRVVDFPLEGRAEMEVVGFALREAVRRNGVNNSQDYPAYWVWLRDLRPMEGLRLEFLGRNPGVVIT